MSDLILSKLLSISSTNVTLIYTTFCLWSINSWHIALMIIEFGTSSVLKHYKQIQGVSTVTRTPYSIQQSNKTTPHYCMQPMQLNHLLFETAETVSPTIRDNKPYGDQRNCTQLHLQVSRL